MGYPIVFNCLLVLPQNFTQNLEVGGRYTVEREGERLFPLNIAIEAAAHDYTYIAKIAVRKLTIETGKTTLEFEPLHIFTPEESKVFSAAFISKEQAQPKTVA